MLQFSRSNPSLLLLAMAGMLMSGCATSLTKSKSHGHSGCSCHGHGESAACADQISGKRRSAPVPDQYPLGSVMRSHLQQMETNGEAADFIIHQHDFVGDSAELTPDGKDRILEIGTRMRSTPFPVLVERTWNNADPELDRWRRDLVAEILTDLGNADANHRVIVAPAYGPGQQAVGSQLESSISARQSAKPFLEISHLNP